MNRWPRVPLSEVLAFAPDPVSVDPEAEYPNLGLYSFARGAFDKPPIDGAKTSAKTLYRVRAGQFIYSRLFAFEGAYAVVSPQMDGCFVSNEYPTFDHDSDRVLPPYLRWLFTVPSVWRDVAVGSKGMGDRRQRVHPEQVLAFRAPLPPLEEQRRIVARLDQVAESVNRVRSQRRALRSDALALIRSLLFGTRLSPNPRMSFSRLARIRPPDITVEPDAYYQFAGVFSFGRGMFRGERKLGSEFSYSRLTRLCLDNFVYPKLMAWEGALAVVPRDCDGCVVSPEFPVFELDTEIIDAAVVDAYFRHPSVWPALGGTSIGTNVRRRRLHPSAILAHELPVPPRRDQKIISTILRRYDPFTVYGLDQDVEALIPALLHEVFNESDRGT